jgi:predicted transcriptional regulator
LKENSQNLKIFLDRRLVTVAPPAVFWDENLPMAKPGQKACENVRPSRAGRDVWLAMATFPKDQVTASQTRIGASAGLTRETVNSALKDLNAQGWVRCLEHRGRKQESNVYLLTQPVWAWKHQAKRLQTECETISHYGVKEGDECEAISHLSVKPFHTKGFVFNKPLSSKDILVGIDGCGKKGEKAIFAVMAGLYEKARGLRLLDCPEHHKIIRRLLRLVTPQELVAAFERYLKASHWVKLQSPLWLFEQHLQEFMVPSGQEPKSANSNNRACSHKNISEKEVYDRFSNQTVNEKQCTDCGATVSVELGGTHA